ILEGVLLLLIGVISPFWTPLPLYRARDSVTWRRRRLLLCCSGGDGDGNHETQGVRGGSSLSSRNNGETQRDGDNDHAQIFTKPVEDAKSAAALAAAAEGVPDLGRRYLDLLGQALRQSRSAASAAATAPYGQEGLPRYRGGHPESFFIDVSAYDEIVLTTEWEADGFLAACMLFGMVSVSVGGGGTTAESRKGTGRPYPLRTVIVPAGKAAQATEAIAAMRRTELIPSGCRVEVLEECRGYGDARPTRSKAHGPGSEGATKPSGRDEEEVEDGGQRALPRSFFGSCSTLVLQSPVLRAIFGRFGEGASWWRAATGWGGDKSAFGHVDLLVSGGFSGGGVFGGREEGEEAERPRWQRWRRRSRSDGVLPLCPHDVEEAMAKVNRVFVVQLDDLVRSYGFPRAIAPDRTPTLSAAMAGARGVLPSCLRRVIAASNHQALTEFPDKVASAISAGRYSNEELRVRASSIAAAAALAEEPGMGRGRAAWAELGARMADLIASDFEALEAAGLSPGTQQAVFRSLDVGMALSDVAAAWALVCQDTVCWESCARIGVDPHAGRLALLYTDDRRGSGGGRDMGASRSQERGDASDGYKYGAFDGTDGYDADDNDDFEDGGDMHRGTGFKRGKGDARGCRGQ
ncbi:unnamed protein product, partial [Scytosiphon promiscuus]